MTIDELFHEDPKTDRRAAQGAAPEVVLVPRLPRDRHRAARGRAATCRKRPRKRAIDKAVAFVTERLNGDDGLGAIYPAMENSVKMYAVLGYPPDHPHRAIARASLDKLLVVKDDEAYCQPCVSPVWDTALVAHALLEAGGEKAIAAANRGLDWLKPLQVLDVKGDWIEQRPNVRPGGWAFQYNNAHYPDLDDTAVVVMAMDRARGRARRRCSTRRSRARANGSSACRARTAAGRRSMPTTPTTTSTTSRSPITARCSIRRPRTSPGAACRCWRSSASGRRPREPMRRAIEWLERDQLPDGSWYGRWGMNYIYGTWSVLCALNAAGVDHQTPMFRKAVDWLLAIQNPDGGWGEDGTSYKLDYRGYETAPSTASQTAWALLGLMAAGEVEHPAVRRGIAYLAEKQGTDGLWDEERYTATGFPRVFYLRYHGYRRFFPLWAMARYRNLKSGNSRVVSFGM